MLFTAIRLVPIACTRVRQSDRWRDCDYSSSSSGGSGSNRCRCRCFCSSVDTCVHKRHSRKIFCLEMNERRCRRLDDDAQFSTFIRRFFWNRKVFSLILILVACVINISLFLPRTTINALPNEQSDWKDEEKMCFEDFCYSESGMWTAIEQPEGILSGKCSQYIPVYTFAINLFQCATSGGWNVTNRWRWHLTHKCFVVSKQFYWLRPARIENGCRVPNEWKQPHKMQTNNQNTNELIKCKVIDDKTCAHVVADNNDAETFYVLCNEMRDT